MDKLEIKHLAPYLPYGLQIYRDYGEGEIEISEMHCLDAANNEIYGESFDTKIRVAEDKPILRPLSDLTKEIEINGESICLFDKYQDLGRDLTDILDDDRWSWEYPYHIVCDFLSWHFDIFGLIKKGLAIDMNTLNEKN